MPPGHVRRPFSVIIVLSIIIIRGKRLGAGEEIVEQTDGKVPFEGHVVGREPAVVRADVGVDEGGAEEVVESGEEEGDVGEARTLDLCV